MTLHETNYLIEEKAKNVLIEYLMGKPMREVEGGVILLRNLKPLESEDNALHPQNENNHQGENK